MSETEFTRGDSHPDGSGRVFWANQRKINAAGDEYYIQRWVTPETFAGYWRKRQQWDASNPDKLRASARLHYDLHLRQPIRKTEEEKRATRRKWEKCNRKRINRMARERRAAKKR